jgi:hypothetical protein
MERMKLFVWGMHTRAPVLTVLLLFFHEQNPRECISIHLNGAIVKVLLVLANSIFGFVSSEESVAPISLPATGEMEMIRRIHAMACS